MHFSSGPCSADLQEVGPQVEDSVAAVDSPAAGVASAEVAPAVAGSLT